MDVILVDRMALPVRMDERMVSDGAEVNHHRSNVLHGVPPSISENYEAKANILPSQFLSTLTMTGYGRSVADWTGPLPSLD